MASIKTEVLIIADAVGKSFNEPVKARIKALLLSGYSKYAKQEMVKYGIQDNYIASYKIELEKVPLTGECTDPSDCMVLRSVNKIIKPIAYRASEPFVSVTTEDGIIVSIKTTRAASKHQKFARFGHNTLMYEIRNDYLYLYNNLKLGVLMLDGIYPTQLFSEDCPNSAMCYNDDFDIPLNGEYLSALRKDILQELGIAFIQNKDIPVAEEVNNVQPTNQ